MNSIQGPEVFSRVGGEVRLLAGCTGQICKGDPLVSKREFMDYRLRNGKEECEKDSSSLYLLLQDACHNLLTCICEVQSLFAVKSG